jgi:hypothetical protein
VSGSLLKVLVVTLALALSGWAAATVLAGDSGQTGVEATPVVLEPADPLPPATGHESPNVPTYAPGAASVVPPDDPVAKQANPTGDPNVRICKFADGTYAQVIVSPVDPKNPFPPGDRTRPC